MEGVLLIAALLACPVGMGLMMWFMSKSGQKNETARSAATPDELRREHARLSAEIERREHEGAGRAP